MVWGSTERAGSCSSGPLHQAPHPALAPCSYSSGPLPGQLIRDCPVPVGMVWGAKDPWEKVEWGRQLAKDGGVADYIELDNVGHCPQDESPHRVNPLIREFAERHA